MTTNDDHQAHKPGPAKAQLTKIPEKSQGKQSL
jgi:hypothetical protein